MYRPLGCRYAEIRTDTAAMIAALRPGGVILVLRVGPPALGSDETGVETLTLVRFDECQVTACPSRMNRFRWNMRWSTVGEIVCPALLRAFTDQ